ncbi:hypothetical protein JCM12141A_57410 [Mycolicibacterium hodleri]
MTVVADTVTDDLASDDAVECEETESGDCRDGFTPPESVDSRDGPASLLSVECVDADWLPPVAPSSAHAIAGHPIAVPIPNATANAPTRPT